MKHYICNIWKLLLQHEMHLWHDTGCLCLMMLMIRILVVFLHLGCYTHQIVVPQVILNFKWSSSKASSLTNKSSSLSNEWPMLWHRVRCPPIGIKVKDPTWGISRATSGVIPTYVVVSIKNTRFKCQPSTPSATLCINKMHTLYGNWWQRGRSGQRYEICKKKHWGEVGILGIGHGHGPRGNIEEIRRIKKIEELRRIKISWTREAHK